MSQYAAPRLGPIAFGTHELPGQADDWLKAIQDQAPALLQKGQELGFNFVSGQRPQPNKQGRIATTLEYAKRLTAADIKLLKGDAAYSEKLPERIRAKHAEEAVSIRWMSYAIRVMTTLWLPSVSVPT
jgi:hypothetical protein